MASPLLFSACSNLRQQRLHKQSILPTPTLDAPTPTIFLVGGAWHTVDYLGPLCNMLNDANYPTVAIGLPSAGTNPATEDFSTDVAAIREKATALISENKEVIAVLHSFGGVPGTEALHGLGKGADGRGRAGGGVIAIVYIASVLPQKGNSYRTHLEAVGDFTWKSAQEAMLKENNRLILPHEFARRMFYHDLEEDEANHWISLLKPQSGGVFESPQTHETYKEIP